MYDKDNDKKAADEILKKVWAGQRLTQEERFIYLTKIVGFTEENARTIIAQSNNKDPNVIID